MPEILVDADSCPVKQEVYRAAKRYGLKVTVVANSQMNIPSEDWLKLRLDVVYKDDHSVPIVLRKDKNKR